MENATKLIQVLAEFGFASLGYTTADFMEVDVIMQIGVAPFRIDLLTVIDGVTSAEYYPNRQNSVLDGIPLAVISIHDLRRNKASTGRAKDQDALRLLSVKYSENLS